MPQAMSTRSQRSNSTVAPETLNGLKLKVLDVWAYCESCQHSASIDIEVLMERLPGTLAVPAVGSVLRCSGCGRRGVFSRPDWKVS